MFVKICGITNRDDAMAAVDAGAGALGFIFYPRSPRAVTAESVASWIGEIPANVWKVGVFVDESPAAIDRIQADLKLDIVQLHGAETPDMYPALPRIWKAVRMQAGSAPPDGYLKAEAMLLDGPGSGQTFDWSVTKTIAQRFVLAGGLTPENVGAAVAATNPWGVDTASGVERAPGRKDHARMKMFIEAALRS